MVLVLFLFFSFVRDELGGVFPLGSLLRRVLCGGNVEGSSLLGLSLCSCSDCLVLTVVNIVGFC
jgi:hypothetical protein